jgi:hypothetical protein
LDAGKDQERWSGGAEKKGRERWFSMYTADCSVFFSLSSVISSRIPRSGTEETLGGESRSNNATLTGF